MTNIPTICINFPIVCLINSFMPNLKLNILRYVYFCNLIHFKIQIYPTIFISFPVSLINSFEPNLKFRYVYFSYQIHFKNTYISATKHILKYRYTWREASGIGGRWVEEIVYRIYMWILLITYTWYIRRETNERVRYLWIHYIWTTMVILKIPKRIYNLQWNLCYFIVKWRHWIPITCSFRMECDTGLSEPTKIIGSC